jgi:hypothetical protein
MPRGSDVHSTRVEQRPENDWRRRFDFQLEYSVQELQQFPAEARLRAVLAGDFGDQQLGPRGDGVIRTVSLIKVPRCRAEAQHEAFKGLQARDVSGENPAQVIRGCHCHPE